MNKEEGSNIAREGFRGRYLLYAFIGGAAAGAITSLLTARASGAETRAQLRASGERGLEKAAQLPEALKAATVAAEEAFLAALKDGNHEGLLPVPRAVEQRHS